MINSRFDRILANFCSPVIMDEKISNLVSVSKLEMPDVHKVIRKYNSFFNKYDIIIEPICECSKRVLILVYRQSQLLKHLGRKDVKSILNDFGYVDIDSLGDNLNVLKSRIVGENFPHEIGIFLGYPIEDVVGFIENKGKDYKYCGYWKVYCDPDEAKMTFDKYDRLKELLTKRINCGESMYSILNQLKNNKKIA